MRVQHLAFYLNGSVAEEIRSVHGLRPFLVVIHLFEDLSSCQLAAAAGYITDLVHVSDSVLRLAHIIDEIGSGFDVLRIFRDYPSVEPNIRTFLRYDIIEHDTHFGCLFDSELSVSGPGEVEPCFAFGHLLFSEVHFPTADLFLGLQQHFFDSRYALGSDITYQLVAVNGTFLNLVCVRIEYQY